MTAEMGLELFVRKSWTHESTIPASSPRQPACIAPRTPSSDHNAIGTQSAVWIASARSNCAVTTASASAPIAASTPTSSQSMQRSPCTCSSHTHRRSVTALRLSSCSDDAAPIAMSPSVRSVHRTRIERPLPSARSKTRTGAETMTTEGTMGRRSCHRHRGRRRRRTHHGQSVDHRGRG